VPSTCTTCTQNTDCTTGHCRNAYCEVN
jgi:hypothetical protein